MKKGFALDDDRLKKWAVVDILGNYLIEFVTFMLQKSFLRKKIDTKSHIKYIHKKDRS